MPTLASIDAHRLANQAVVDLALADLAGFWASLDLGRPEAARDALLAYYPALSDEYGRVAATVAAQWYDAERAASVASGRFRAQVAPPMVKAAPYGTTRRLAGWLWTDTPAKALPGLDDKLSAYVLQPGRDTIANAAAADPAHARWARVTRGAETCDWCRMLAGRGAVYRSAADAGESSDWHGHCHCEAVPLWSPDDLPVTA